MTYPACCFLSPLFLPVSAQGGLVFANYGRREDFAALRQLGVDPQGNLALVRLGEISFAEKVSALDSFGPWEQSPAWS